MSMIEFQSVPSAAESDLDRRMKELMRKMAQRHATPDERKEYKTLSLKRVRRMRPSIFSGLRRRKAS